MKTRHFAAIGMLLIAANGCAPRALVHSDDARIGRVLTVRALVIPNVTAASTVAVPGGTVTIQAYGSPVFVIYVHKIAFPDGRTAHSQGVIKHSVGDCVRVSGKSIPENAANDPFSLDPRELERAPDCN